MRLQTRDLRKAGMGIGEGKWVGKGEERRGRGRSGELAGRADRWKGQEGRGKGGGA